MRLLKASHLLFLVLGIALSLTSCNEDCEDGFCPCEDPCANPTECPDQCTLETTLTRNDVEPEGTVVDLENGFSVEGALTIKGKNDDPDIVFNNANLIVEFHENGIIKSISGSADIPSPDPCLQFTQTVNGEINFYTGEYINNNLGLDITLKDEISYFIFYIGTDTHVDVCSVDLAGNISTEPLSFEAPLGGKIAMVADFKDPMAYFYIQQDYLGSLSWGRSFKSQIPYIPAYPTEQIVEFDGRTFIGQGYSIFKILALEGHMVYSLPFGKLMLAQEAFEQDFVIEGNVGLNGKIGLSPIIESLAGVEIELAGASGAISSVIDPTTTELAYNQAFIRGRTGQRADWLPEFIPLRPGFNIGFSGYVNSTQEFEYILSGGYELILPTQTEAIDGQFTLKNDSAKFAGFLLFDEREWACEAIVTNASTEFNATPPDDMLSGLDDSVNEAIDDAFEESIDAYENLQEATENYEFELSLRGLREELPGIIQGAKDALATAISNGKAAGRAAANSELNKRGQALCGDNISSIVGNADNAYVNALNRLSNAVSETNDNETTRIELEAALRDLCRYSRLSTRVYATILPGNKQYSYDLGLTKVTVPACETTFTTFRVPVDLDITVLSAEVVEKLQEAADNVKYIGETSDIKIAAQDIFDQAPSADDIGRLKEEIQSGITTIPTLEKVGVVVGHKDGTFTYYLIFEDREVEISSLRVFRGDNLSQAIFKSML